MMGMEGYTQNYYAEDYAKGTNVTFKCTTRYSKKRLVSNVTNQKVMSLQVLKNGLDAGPDFYRKISSNDPTNEKLYGIFRTSFTGAEIDRLKKAGARLMGNPGQMGGFQAVAFLSAVLLAVKTANRRVIPYLCLYSKSKCILNLNCVPYRRDNRWSLQRTKYSLGCLDAIYTMQS